MQPNRLKQLFAAGDVAIGSMVMEFDTSGLSRVAAAAGADFLIYDREHTGWTAERMRMLMTASRADSLVPSVRALRRGRVPERGRPEQVREMPGGVGLPREHPAHPERCGLRLVRAGAGRSRSCSQRNERLTPYVHIPSSFTANSAHERAGDPDRYTHTTTRRH